jgi:hypothetical protein
MTSIIPDRCPWCRHIGLHVIDIQDDFKVYTCVNCKEFIGDDESMNAETLQLLLELDASNDDEFHVELKFHIATCEVCRNEDSDLFKVLDYRSDEDAGEAVSNLLIECLNCSHTQTIYFIAQDNDDGGDAVNDNRRILNSTCDLCHNENGDLFEVLDIQSNEIDAGDVVTQVLVKCLCCDHQQTHLVVGRSNELSVHESDSSGDNDNLEWGFETQSEVMSSCMCGDCQCGTLSVCTPPEVYVDTCWKCNASRADGLIEEVYDVNGKLIQLHCWVCDEDLQLPERSFPQPEHCDSVNAMDFERDKSYTRGCMSAPSRRKINNLRELRRGDHIAFHRPYAIWHHAIVAEDVHLNGCCGRVKVIHNSGTANEKLRGKGASVREEETDIDLRKDELYRHNYDSVGGRRYSADEIVRRARSRIGEKYNPLTFNCEHFARWCTSGEQKSEQCKTLGERLGIAGGCTAVKLLQEGIASAVECASSASSTTFRELVAGATERGVDTCLRASVKCREQ